jgi:hypothetical protein
MNIPAETMIGLVPNMGTEYHAMTATPENLDAPVSKSLLWAFHKSPFKWFNKPKEEANDRMKFGSLVHAMCFTPEKIEDQFVLSQYDDFRTKEAREWKADVQSKGVEVIKEADWQRAESVAETVMESEYIHSLGECEYEVAAFGKIGNTLIKGMIDILPKFGEKLADLKVTASIGDEKDMQKLVWNMGYHWQAALYLDLYNGLSGKPARDTFEFFFIEDAYPHEIAVVKLSESFIQKGREGYMNAVAKWQNALSLKKFSPKHENIVEIDPPAWA